MTPDSAAVAAIGRDVVRPLIWEAHNVDKTIWSTEVSVTGEYLVKFTGSEWQASRGAFIVGAASTSDEAKAKAQLFHATRILSAIDPAFIARIEALEAENAELRPRRPPMQNEITEARIRKAGQVAVDELVDRIYNRLSTPTKDDLADYMTRIVDACASAALARTTQEATNAEDGDNGTVSISGRKGTQNVEI